MAGWSDSDELVMDDMFPFLGMTQTPTSDGLPYFDSGKMPVEQGWTKFSLPEPNYPIPMNKEGYFEHEEQPYYNATSSVDCSQVLPPDRNCINFGKRYATTECKDQRLEWRECCLGNYTPMCISVSRMFYTQSAPWKFTKFPECECIDQWNDGGSCAA